MKPHHIFFALIALLVSASPALAQRVASVEALVAALAEAEGGAVIDLAEGTFKLTQPLDLKSGLTLKGAGIGKTIVTHAEKWQANPATLPDPETDHGGNLVSSFGDVPAKGPAKFHNNLVSNPGRGVMWMNEPYTNLEVRNNHIIARTTGTPRTEGLFGFNDKSDFKTFSFTGNIIECIGTARPLFRNDASGGATVENNKLTNVPDTVRYANAKTGKPQGLEQPLKSQCGVNGEMTVDGWKTGKTPAK